MRFSRILTVRHPCKKVYPLGPIYLMSIIKRSAPELTQKLLDLASVRPNQRRGILQEAIRNYQPDVIVFSWRDIQVFAPHDMDSAMKNTFAFFYDISPMRRISAAFKGLGHSVLQPGMRLSTDYVHGRHSIYSRSRINNLRTP